MPTNANFLIRRTSAYERYSTVLGSIYRDGQRIWDPSYALSEDPDIYWKVRLDAVADGAIERRLHATVGREWTLEPFSDEEHDKTAAGIMEELLRKIHRFDASRKALAEAAFTGSAFAWVNGHWRTEPIWDRKPRRWWIPEKLKDVDRRRLRAYAIEIKEGENKGKMRTEWRFAGLKQFGMDKTIDHPEFLLKHWYDDRESTLGYGRGIMDSLYFYYRAKVIVLKEGLSGLERWARGLLTMKLDGARDASTGKSNDAIVTAALDTLEQMRSRHELVFDKNDEIEVHDAPGGGNAIVKDMLDYLDKWLIIRIEGSYLPSAGSGEGGAFAQSQTQARKSNEMVAMDRDMLDDVFTSQLVPLVWRLNKATMVDLDPTLKAAQCPRFRTIEEQIQDPMLNVQVAKEALAAGIPLKREEVYRRIGWEMPSPGDEIVEGVKPVAPGGFPGQGGFGGEDGSGQSPEPFRARVVRFGKGFDESKHPRGQPGNPGQFGPGGGGESDEGAPATRKAPALEYVEEDGAVKASPHERLVVFNRFREERGGGNASWQVKREEVDLDREMDVARMATQAAFDVWTSDEADARRIRMASEKKRDPLPAAHPKFGATLIHTLNPRDAGMGSSSIGGKGMRVFWAPYSAPDRVKRFRHDNGYTLHDQIEVDPAYVLAHELHHSFGSGSEFDHGSEVAAIATHLESGLTLSDAWKSTLRRIALGSLDRKDTLSRATMRYLHKRYPDLLKEAVAQTGFGGEWERMVQSFQSLGKHKKREDNPLDNDQPEA